MQGAPTQHKFKGTGEHLKEINEFVYKLTKGTLIEYRDCTTGEDERAIFIEALGGDRMQALLKREKEDRFFLVSYCDIRTRPPRMYKYFRILLDPGCQRQPVLESSWDMRKVCDEKKVWLSEIIKVKAELL